MTTEWIIELTANHPMAALELDGTSVTFDKAFVLEADTPSVFVDVGTGVSYDKAISAYGIGDGANLVIYPSKDWAMGGDAEGLTKTQLVTDAKKGVSAKMSAEISSGFLQAELNPSLDVTDQLTANLLGGMLLYTSPSADRADTLSAIVIDDIRIEVSYLERAFLTIPPDGVVSILNSSSGTQGELKFDKSQVERGVTTILQAEVTGTRLDTYIIDFFVKISENDLPFIHKSSSPTKGGITVESITPAPDAPGSRQLAILQIVLHPEDTAMIEKTRTCLYDLRFSNKGAKEDYRVSPKKDRGDTGTFTIII